MTAVLKCCDGNFELKFEFSMGIFEMNFKLGEKILFLLIGHYHQVSWYLSYTEHNSDLHPLILRQRKECKPQRVQGLDLDPG